MRRISLFIVINAISLYIVSVLMKSVYIGSLASLITLTIIFGLLNLIVKPVIEFFSLPITFVVNGLVLKLAFNIVPGTSLHGFFNAIIAAVLLTIANTIFYNVFDS